MHAEGLVKPIELLIVFGSYESVSNTSPSVNVFSNAQSTEITTSAFERRRRWEESLIKEKI